MEQESSTDCSATSHELARPALTSHDVVIASIAATTTATGLSVTPNSTRHLPRPEIQDQRTPT